MEDIPYIYNDFPYIDGEELEEWNKKQLEAFDRYQALLDQGVDMTWIEEYYLYCKGQETIRQAGEDAAATNMASGITSRNMDGVLAGTLSMKAMEYQSYRAQGLSAEKAREKLYGTELKNIATDGLQGGVIGGALTGIRKLFSATDRPQEIENADTLTHAEAEGKGLQDADGNGKLYEKGDINPIEDLSKADASGKKNVPDTMDTNPVADVDGVTQGKPKQDSGVDGNLQREIDIEPVKGDIEGGSKTKLNYITSSGLELESTPNRTTTVLGTYDSDTKAILNELGNVKSIDFGPRDGGFNLLNTPDDLYVTPDQFWNEYNKPWLDNVIAREDLVMMATEPTWNNITRINKITGKIELSGFGREYFYLRQHGYHYDAILKMMVK